MTERIALGVVAAVALFAVLIFLFVLGYSFGASATAAVEGQAEVARIGVQTVGVDDDGADDWAGR